MTRLPKCWPASYQLSSVARAPSPAAFDFDLGVDFDFGFDLDFGLDLIFYPAPPSGPPQ
jgi:hypothetical protein